MSTHPVARRLTSASRVAFMMILTASCAATSMARRPAHAPGDPMQTVTWSDFEPAVESCFELVPDGHGSFNASAEGAAHSAAAAALPEIVHDFVSLGCLRAALRVSLTMVDAEAAAKDVAARDGIDAGTTALRHALFANERTARIIRATVATELAEGHIASGERGQTGGHQLANAPSVIEDTRSSRSGPIGENCRNEPGGVSPRRLSPAARIRGLTPPGSPRWNCRRISNLLASALM